MPTYTIKQELPYLTWSAEQSATDPIEAMMILDDYYFGKTPFTYSGCERGADGAYDVYTGGTYVMSLLRQDA